MKMKLFFVAMCMLVSLAGKAQNAPDLTYYQLKGAVKTLIMNGDTVQFNANGVITSVNGKDLFAVEAPYREMNDEEGYFIDIPKWTRNEQGQLCEISLLESEDEIIWENGKVAYVTGEGEGMNYKISYTYDEEGNLIEVTEAFWGYYDGAADEAEVYKTTFRIVETDAYGNWIKRERTSNDNTNEEERTIVYYETTSTPYLVAMEVNGPVKTIKEDKVEIEVYTMEFSEDGELTSFSDSGGELDISCFDNQLQLYAPGAFFINVELDEEGQRVKSRSEGFTQSVTSNYVYDSNGNLTAVKVVVDEKKPVTKQVKVLATDAYGNWTQRMIGDQLYKRTMTYYE